VPLPAAGPPLDPHEWISFDDRTEKRTWLVDATFLRSSWSCIFGSGCKGVLDADASEMVQGCCSYGAHFVDDDDVRYLDGLDTQVGDGITVSIIPAVAGG